MGLLDSVLGAALGTGQPQGGGQGDLLQSVLAMLLSGNQGGGGGGGGALGGLLDALRQGGLGSQLDSWISTGANQPVSPDDLQGALDGSDLLGQLARQLGGSQGDAASVLSQVLPGLIDQLTPHGDPGELQRAATGEVPGGLDLGSIGALLGQLGRR